MPPIPSPPSPPSPPVARVRLGGGADVVLAVPYLLGYVPERSVVALGLGGPRAEVRVTARCDLPVDAASAATEVRDVVAAVVAPLPRVAATALVLLVYDEEHDVRARWLPLVAEADRRARAAGIELVAALGVTQDRWSTLLCADSACCPPEGWPLPRPGEHPRVEAPFVSAGIAPLPSRAALAGLLDPPADRIPAAHVAQRRAVERWRRRRRRAGSAAAAREVQADLAGRAVAALGAAVARRSEGRGDVTDGEAAELVAALRWPVPRDAVLLAALDGDVVPTLDVLVRCAALAAPAGAAAAMAVLGTVAYLHGEGALANLAVDRALAADPRTTLARLTRAALDAALPPHGVRAGLLEARGEIEAQLSAAPPP